MDRKDRWHWRDAWRRKDFRAALLAGAAIGLALIFVLPRFFAWLGGRPGLYMDDPVLLAWGPVDLSAITFAVLYGTLALALGTAAKYPSRILHGLWAYILMLLMRMAAMALVTLEPPGDIIPLVDPVTQSFYPGQAPFLKDLFFSGHTATLVLMAFLLPRGMARWAVAAGAAAVAALVVAQHVHWTVDVLAAVPAAWLAWSIAGRGLRRFVPGA